MWPHPASVARALLTGCRPGNLYVAFRPSPQPVCYATDAHGRLLLLAHDDTPVGRTLWPRAEGQAVAAVLEVADDPCRGRPSLGRAWASGWARPLAGMGARAAALDFAAVHPTGLLLDVGRGTTLYHVDLAAVRLERAGAALEVDPAQFAAAPVATPPQLARLREQIARTAAQDGEASTSPVR